MVAGLSQGRQLHLQSGYNPPLLRLVYASDTAPIAQDSHPYHSHSTQGVPRSPLMMMGFDQFERLLQDWDHMDIWRLMQAACQRVKDIVEGYVFPLDILDPEEAFAQGIFLCLFSEQVDTDHLAKLLLEGLACPFTLGDQQVSLTVSIGMAFCSEADPMLPACIDQARWAMEAARQAGGNRYIVSQCWEQQAEQQFTKDFEWVLNQGDFQVYYQPQFDLASGRLTGAEALLRWQHPQWGGLSPGKFIAIAEETGFICSLGERVLRQACHQARVWQQLTASPFKMAVNLSARQLEDPMLYPLIADTLAETGLPAASLELELTESALMRDMNSAVRKIQALKTLGVGLAMDDFGVGYSSLKYLQQLPFDKIKIDRSFVAGVDHNRVNAAITASVIDLGHKLGLVVVGEGVETLAEQTFLAEHHCDEIQGYLVGRPVPANLFTHYLCQVHAHESDAVS